MKHVSEEQLVAYRDGEDDPYVREHLASCEKCQEKFDDARWSLSLQRLVAAEHGSHPSSEELIAFWDNALSSEAAWRIQRHLRGCNRCLAVYRRMRGVGPARAYASPPPHLMRKVRKRFSSRPPALDLGELWLRWTGKALELTRPPVEQCSLDLMCETGLAELAHPASARARKQRFARSVRSERGKPFRLSAGDLRLELRVAGSDAGQAELEVRLFRADTDEPARSIPVAVRSPDGGVASEARTDERGSARLDLPGGSCRLDILASTPLTLRLAAD